MVAERNPHPRRLYRPILLAPRAIAAVPARARDGGAVPVWLPVLFAALDAFV
jgi:hypothetical protein